MMRCPPNQVTRTAAGLAVLVLLLAGCGPAPTAVPAPTSVSASNGPGSPAPATGAPSTAPIVSPAAPAGVSPAASPVPSPVLTGRLAVLLVAPGTTRIEVTAADGGSLALPAPSTRIVSVSSSADGRLAVRDSAGRVWVTQRAVSRSASVTWSSIDPGAAVIARLPGPIVGVTWEPDGSALLGLAAEVAGGDSSLGLVVLPAGSGTARLDLVALRPGGGLAWTLGDGRRLLAARIASDRSELMLVDGARATSLGTAAYEVAVSADRSTAAVLGPGATVRTGPLAGLLRGGTEGTIVDAPAGLTAGTFALDATGGQLAVAWLDETGTPASLVAYRLAGARWAATRTLEVAAGTTIAAPAWLP